MNPVAWREDLCSGSAVCKHDSSEMGLPASPSLGTASQCACRTFWLWSQYLNLALRTGAKRKKKKKLWIHSLWLKYVQSLHRRSVPGGSCDVTPAERQGRAARHWSSV